MNIYDFVESLKKLDPSMSSEYDPYKYKGEIADIKRLSKEDVNKAAAYIIALQKKIMKSGDFELTHPFKNEIKVRPVQAFYTHLGKKDEYFSRIIIFSDSKYENPILFHQIHNFFDFIIADDKLIKYDFIYEVDVSFLKHYYNIIKKQGLDLKQSCKIAFSFNQCRPYHFFKEQLYSALKIFEEEKNFSYLYTGKEFFIFDGFKKKEVDNDAILLAPTCIMNYGFDFVRNKVLEQSLQRHSNTHPRESFLAKNCDLKIFFGIAGERRIWLNQAKNIVFILKNLKKYFNSILVFIDGNTAFEGKKAEFTDNKKAFREILDVAKKDIKSLVLSLDEDNNVTSNQDFIAFKHLSGYDYKDKIFYLSLCDISICESGSTALVPFIIHQKPGLIYSGNIDYIFNFSKSLIKDQRFQKILDKKHTTYEQSKEKYDYLFFNYHLNTSCIYNLAAEVLEELSKEGKLKIKNLKMHRLFVPEVELVKRQYDLAKALACDLPLLDENNIEYFKKIGEYFLNKENEVENKNKELQNLKTQIQNLNSNISSLQNENKSLKENLLFPHAE